MADLNDVIARIKAEGQLIRNTGTNSIKRSNELLSEQTDVLRTIGRNLNKMTIVQARADINQNGIKRPERVSPVSETSGFGIFKALTAAISEKTIGQFGIGKSQRASKVRSAIASPFQKAYAAVTDPIKEKREQLIDKLLDIARLKPKSGVEEDQQQQQFEEFTGTVTDNLGEDGSIATAIGNQTNVITSIYNLLADMITTDRNKELERQDLALTENRFQPTKEVIAPMDKETKNPFVGILDKFAGIAALGAGLAALASLVGSFATIITVAGTAAIGAAAAVIAAVAAPVVLGLTAVGAAIAGVITGGILGAAKVGDYIEDLLGIKKKIEKYTNTPEFKQRGAEVKEAGKKFGGNTKIEKAKSNRDIMLEAGKAGITQKDIGKLFYKERDDDFLVLKGDKFAGKLYQKSTGQIISKDEAGQLTIPTIVPQTHILPDPIKLIKPSARLSIPQKNDPSRGELYNTDGTLKSDLDKLVPSPIISPKGIAISRGSKDVEAAKTNTANIINAPTDARSSTVNNTVVNNSRGGISKAPAARKSILRGGVYDWGMSYP